MINFEGGAIPEEYLVEYVADRVETTSNTWMGLTMGCARCHSHKYDPISQKEFYQFFAFFNSVSEKGLDGKTATPRRSCNCPRPIRKRAPKISQRRSKSAEAVIERQARHRCDRRLESVARRQARVQSITTRSGRSLSDGRQPRR